MKKKALPKNKKQKTKNLDSIRGTAETQKLQKSGPLP
jgi:hypothetical protein